MAKGHDSPRAGRSGGRPGPARRHRRRGCGQGCGQGCGPRVTPRVTPRDTRHDTSRRGPRDRPCDRPCAAPRGEGENPLALALPSTMFRTSSGGESLAPGQRSQVGPMTGCSVLGGGEAGRRNRTVARRSARGRCSAARSVGPLSHDIRAAIAASGHHAPPAGGRESERSRSWRSPNIRSARPNATCAGRMTRWSQALSMSAQTAASCAARTMCAAPAVTTAAVKSSPWSRKSTSTRTEPIASGRHDRRCACVRADVFMRRRRSIGSGDERGNGNGQLHVSA